MRVLFGAFRQGKKKATLSSSLLSKRWLREPDLNRRPSGYEPDELPDCSIPRLCGGILQSNAEVSIFNAEHRQINPIYCLGVHKLWSHKAFIPERHAPPAHALFKGGHGRRYREDWKVTGTKKATLASSLF